MDVKDINVTNEYFNEYRKLLKKRCELDFRIDFIEQIIKDSYDDQIDYFEVKYFDSHDNLIRKVSSK